MLLHLYFCNNSDDVFKYCDNSIKFFVSNTVANKPKFEFGKDEIKGDNNSKAKGDSVSLLK